MSEFNEKIYKENLLSILGAAREEYKVESLDWRNRQTGILKTYLWLSATILAAQFSLLSPIWVGKTSLFLPAIHPNAIFFIFATVAFALSLVAFVFAADTMRGRGLVLFPYQSTYVQLCDKAYEEADGTELVNTTYVMQIVELEKSIESHRKQNNVVGKKLRIISYLLLLAMLSTALAFYAALTTFWGN